MTREAKFTIDDLVEFKNDIDTGVWAVIEEGEWINDEMYWYKLNKGNQYRDAEERELRLVHRESDIRTDAQCRRIYEEIRGWVEADIDPGDLWVRVRNLIYNENI